MTMMKPATLILFAFLTCVTTIDKAAAADLGTDQNTEPTIAVVDLLDKGPSVELAVLRTAFGEMLAGELSQYQGIGVVERATCRFDILPSRLLRPERVE